MKIKITESDIRKMVAQTVKRVLKEGYGFGDPTFDRKYDEWRTREPEDWNEPDPDICIPMEENENTSYEDIDAILSMMKDRGLVSIYNFDDEEQAFLIYCGSDEDDGSEYEEGGRYPMNMRNAKPRIIHYDDKVKQMLDKEGIVYYEP